MELFNLKGNFLIESTNLLEEENVARKVGFLDFVISQIFVRYFKYF